MLDKLKNPINSQIRTLRRLMRNAASSDLGQQYYFNSILRSKQIVNRFQDEVPIFTYEELKSSFWDKRDNHFTHNTWKGNFKYFAQSSGTSGAPSKQIPITNQTLRITQAKSIKVIKDLTNFGIPYHLFFKDKLMLGGCLDLEKSQGLEYGDLSGIYANHLPSWINYNYMPGKEIAAINDWDEKLGRIVEEAPNWDISFIVGMPSWLLLTIERITKHYQLETIHDIWPNLSVFIHGGVHLDAYLDAFNKVLAKDLIFVNTYLASEGFIAYQQKPEYKGMNLNLNAGIFYEFVAFNLDNFDTEGNVSADVKVCSILDVQEDIEYAIIITTTNGLWRYLLGDTIRFLNTERLEIIITGRVSQYLSLCGEHLSVENMNEAIKLTEQELNIHVREFTVYGSQHGASVTHQWYLSKDQNCSKEDALITSTLDKYLKMLNDDYRTERDHFLSIELVRLPLNIFYAWQAKNGNMGGQNKFPRVMKGERYKDWESFINAAEIA